MKLKTLSRGYGAEWPVVISTYVCQLVVNVCRVVSPSKLEPSDGSPKSNSLLSTPSRTVTIRRRRVRHHKPDASTPDTYQYK